MITANSAILWFEDVLFRMIRDLNATDNALVVIQPDAEDPPAWFASVAMLEEGGFEVEYRDMAMASTN